VKIPYVDLGLQHRPLKDELLKAVEGVLDDLLLQLNRLELVVKERQGSLEALAIAVQGAVHLLGLRRRSPRTIVVPTVTENIWPNEVYGDIQSNVRVKKITSQCIIYFQIR